MKKQNGNTAERARTSRKPSAIPNRARATVSKLETVVRPQATWPERLHDMLRDIGVRQVAYVPDSGHKRLIELVRADKEMKAIPLTSEEEGAALAVGAWLGGDRSVLLTQSSGVGNIINMLAMVAECRTPMLILVTMRGQWGEFNPWQLPMAQATESVLTSMGAVVQRVDDPEDVVQTVSAAARLTFNTSRIVAVLISQRIIGAKEFK